MATKWSEANSEVIHMAEDLIKKYHQNLEKANIGFLFREKASKSQGMWVLAKAQKTPEKLKAILDFDFIIWVSEEDWGRLNGKLREALIDHELMHCAGFPGAWKIRGHDFEDFNEIIERHGYWTPALMKIEHAERIHYAQQAAQQLKLIDDEFAKHGKVEAVDPKVMKGTDTDTDSDEEEPEDHAVAADNLLSEFLEAHENENDEESDL